MPSPSATMTPAELAEFRRKNNEQQRLRRIRRKHEDPAKHRCACSNVAVEWDDSTKSYRCARCRDWEASHYSAWRVNRLRQYVEAFTVHLPYGMHI